MIKRTEAVVLRRMEYGETSLILRLFTRHRGRMSVIAKGARSAKTRFGSTLQPMSYVQVVYYDRATRDLQTLSEASHVRPFPRLLASLPKMHVGMRVLELTDQLVEDGEANPSMFNLLLDVLTTLDVAEARYENLWAYFQLRMATLLGFAPDLDRDAVQALDDAGGALVLDAGAVVPREWAGGAPSRRASRGALRAFAILARADLGTILRMHLRPEVLSETDALADAYLRYHVEHLRPSRSGDVFGQMHRP